MKRAIREHSKDILALVGLVAAALTSTFIILANQGAALPQWLPVIGSDRFELRAAFSTAQAVTPGQGQSVDIAGIRVGDVTGVELEDGEAVVTMEVENEYAPLIKDDASLLLRPKTGLNDMVVEVDPGEGEEVEEGTTLPLANTEPNVNPDEILATLDADTRNFLVLLLQGGAEGLGGRGRELSAAFRRFEPLARDISLFNGKLAQRRQSLRRVIHNFRIFNEALSERDGELAAFVDNSNAVLSRFANQEANIRETLRELPPTLRATLGALRSGDEFALASGPALRKLLPGAAALDDALRATRPFFRETVGPIRDQIRPFTRQMQVPTEHLRQMAEQLGNVTPNLNTSFAGLNRLVNALAFNPPGQNEGFLFWLPWLNHNTNSIFLTQDAHGPLRRGVVMITCNTSNRAITTIEGLHNLKTLFDLNNVPRPAGPNGICSF